MRNVRIPPKTQWSIFGDTYGGVPSPNTVLVHGYPTRYHGPNFTVPQQGYQYNLRPYARAPFLGLGQFVATAVKRATSPRRVPRAKGRSRPARYAAALDMGPVWDADEVWRDWKFCRLDCHPEWETNPPTGKAKLDLELRCSANIEKIRSALEFLGMPTERRKGGSEWWTRQDSHGLSRFVEVYLGRSALSQCGPFPTQENLRALQAEVRKKRKRMTGAAVRTPVTTAAAGERTAFWDPNTIWNVWVYQCSGKEMAPASCVAALDNIRAALQYLGIRVGDLNYGDTWETGDLFAHREFEERFMGKTEGHPLPSLPSLQAMQVAVENKRKHLRSVARRPFAMRVSGLGDMSEIVQSRWFDAIVGAAAGILASPSRDSELVYGGVGALAAALFGKVGIAVVVGAAAGSKMLKQPLPRFDLKPRTTTKFPALEGER